MFIKAAVRQLRFDHPAMASQVESMAESSTPVFVYQTPDSETDIDEWLSRVVIDKTNGLLESGGDIDKVIETLTYELGTPLARPLFLVHYIPATSSDEKLALVFYLNHSVFDAIESQTLWQRVVQETICLGERKRRDFPLPIVYPPRSPTMPKRLPEDEIMVQRAKRCMEAMLTSHKLPIPHPYSPPSGTGLFTRVASANLVTSLRNAARAHGCTIFTVLWAAMVLSSIRTRSPDPSATKNITLPFIPSPVDLRYLACDDRYDRSQWKVRLSMGFHAYIAEDLARFVDGSTLNGDDDAKRLAEDFWVLAKEAREQTQEQQKYTERMPVWTDDLMNAIGEGEGFWAMKPYYQQNGVQSSPPSESWTSTLLVHILSQTLGNNSFPTFNTGSGLALHAFTWEGELMMSFTFPEGTMGTAQHQVKALKEGHQVDAIVLEFVNEFMSILDVISRMN
ncbi:hypothetical protein BT96DRAFT_941929 [Gymnopus androsaceus JB14]|uniref:CoA-dependent acyltransferase n=1 Tax=Gymnopus androsaceus JB14 TaxID=1447944 RepID=A0A6A4HDW7_9AGAR|nr:hypothetical protein BT96DRAFT_941929 [Gymnopus androsaceus JB14]